MAVKIPSIMLRLFVFTITATYKNINCCLGEIWKNFANLFTSGLCQWPSAYSVFSYILLGFWWWAVAHPYSRDNDVREAERRGLFYMVMNGADTRAHLCSYYIQYYLQRSPIKMSSPPSKGGGHAPPSLLLCGKGWPDMSCRRWFLETE